MSALKLKQENIRLKKLLTEALPHVVDARDTTAVMFPTAAKQLQKLIDQITEATKPSAHPPHQPA